jgi:hypothetical protein
LKKSLKILLLATLITLSVWALVIFYWQVTIYAPSNTDLFYFLVLAPAALFSFVMVVNKVSRYILQPKEQNETTETTAESASQSRSETSIATGRDWYLPLVFSQIVTFHGESVSDLISAADEKATKFELDKDLVDAEGFPFMTARIADLDAEKTFEDFDAWAAEYKPIEAENVSWLTEDKRTLHLLYTVFSGLLREVLSNDHIAELLASHLDNSKLPIPNIYLLNIVPDHWLPAKRALLDDWIRSEVTRQHWPESQVLNNSLKHEGLNAWQVLDAVNESVHQANKLGIYLITAAQSYLGERTFSEYEAADKLLTAKNKSGLVYGEASAGVVVVDEHLAAKFEDLTVIQLHRAAVRRRDKSADASGKITSTLLEDVMKDALLVAKIDAENIKAVAADTDSRISRVTELFSAVNEFLTEIDAEKSTLKLQDSCGMVGVAAGLASLVYAMDKVIADEAPVLWVSNTDGFDRCALVLNLPINPSLEQGEPS